MPQLNQIFVQLEACADELPMEEINAHRLKTVLKAIMKLENIPLDNKFLFRKRAMEIREKWIQRGEMDGHDSALTTPTVVVAVVDKSNGLSKEASKSSKEDAVDADGDAMMSGANNVQVERPTDRMFGGVDETSPITKPEPPVEVEEEEAESDGNAESADGEDGEENDEDNQADAEDDQDVEKEPEDDDSDKEKDDD